MTDRRLALLTTDEVKRLVAKRPTAVLVPVGSVEPHGPHLPLDTDTRISEVASERAARRLTGAGIDAWIAPSVPYGVTDFAQGFAGAIGVPADVLRALLRAIADRLLITGFSHVCFVNNHLEPAHDRAVRDAVVDLPRVSIACPLTRRWARTLSDEFKRGDCHAGRYETSLALATGAAVRAEYTQLPALATSLSDEIKAGRTSFAAMGLARAYTGTPSEATSEEGDALLTKLADMIFTEVNEGLQRAP